MIDEDKPGMGKTTVEPPIYLSGFTFQDIYLSGVTFQDQELPFSINGGQRLRLAGPGITKEDLNNYCNLKINMKMGTAKADPCPIFQFFLLT